MKKNLRLHGIGLIEILVALVIVGIIAAIATPSMAGFLERRRIIAATDEVANLIRFAQTEARTNGRGTRILLQDGTANGMSCASVVSLNPASLCKCYESSCTTSGERLFRSYQLLHNSTTVSFSASAPRWGIPANTIKITKTDKEVDVKGVVIEVTGSITGARLRIALQDTGFLKICSVGNGFVGYPVCS
jgi:type IV fimbrial biogenesis protein FimT